MIRELLSRLEELTWRVEAAPSIRLLEAMQSSLILACDELDCRVGQVFSAGLQWQRADLVLKTFANILSSGAISPLQASDNALILEFCGNVLAEIGKGTYD